MKDMAYYKANKVADVHGVLENADQLIADDIAKFADTLSDVFSNLLKPVVDFVLFSVRMTTTMGAFGPIGMYSWFAIATVISAKVRAHKLDDLTLSGHSCTVFFWALFCKCGPVCHSV